MLDFLSYQFQDTPEFVNAFDELPIWSAAFGLLLLNNLSLQPGITIVDAGCGTGFPLLELAGRVGNTGKLYGIDPWTNAVNRARTKIIKYGYKNVEIFEQSAEQIPLADSTVDLIVSNLGINNFENREVVFSECYRALKKGGKMAITSNLNGHWKLFYELFEETLRMLGKANYVDNLKEQQEHRGTEESIKMLFSGAGFDITKIVIDNLSLNFANGTAFLNHHFIKLGWLTSWLDIFPIQERAEIFGALEASLNNHALASGGFHLQVPMIFIEGQKYE